METEGDANSARESGDAQSGEFEAAARRFRFLFWSEYTIYLFILFFYLFWVKLSPQDTWQVQSMHVQA